MAGGDARLRRAHLRPAWAFLLVMAVTGLTACGGSDKNPYGLSNFAGESPGATTSASSPAASAATASPSASTPVLDANGRPPKGAVGYAPADPPKIGAWVQRGVIEAGPGPAEEAVQAAMAYMSLRVQLSNTWKVSKTALAKVSTGQALSGAIERAKRQKAAGSRSVGPFVLNLSLVQVSGASATAIGCPYDGTREYAAGGGLISDAPGRLKLTLKFVRSAAGWQVSSFSLPGNGCDEPTR